MLDAILAHLEPRAALLDAFVDRVPAESYAATLDALRRRVGDVVFALLAAQRGELRHRDLERMTWTALTVVQNLTVRYVLERPPITRDDFLDDLTAILLGIGLG